MREAGVFCAPRPGETAFLNPLRAVSLGPMDPAAPQSHAHSKPETAHEAARRRSYMTVGVWIIATAAIGFALHEGAEIVAPFALAIFVWLVMEGFAREIR